MPVSELFNPVLLSHIDKFQRVLEELKAVVRKEGDLDERKVVALARELCILSREIRVKLTPSGDAAQEVVAKVVKMFRDAAKPIKAAHKLVSDKETRDVIEQYSSNIVQRADRIQSGDQ